MLNDSEITNKTINAGRSGASWINYPQTLKYIHKKYNPDVYVIQHTTPDRGMLLFSANKDKYQRITRDHDIYENYIQLWDNTQSYYHLTVGMAEQFLKNPQSDFVNHMLNEIKRKSSLAPGNIIERVKYWYEQERHHPLMFEKFEETVDYCDMYVKRLGKKIIHLFWLDDSFVVNMNGSITVLVSGGFNFLTEYLKELLGFKYTHANTLQIIQKEFQKFEITGKVEGPILDKKAKLQYLNKYVKKYNLNYKDTICVGDGANDIEMIKHTGLGVSYYGKSALKKEADIHFNNTNLLGLLYAQGYTDNDIIK